MRGHQLIPAQIPSSHLMLKPRGVEEQMSEVEATTYWERFSLLV